MYDQGGWPRKAVMMPMRIPLLWVILLWASIAGAAERGVGPVPAELRQALGLDEFYQQHVDAGGIAVVGSAKVSPHALLEAAYLIERMLEGRADLRRALADAKARITVMAHNEFTTDVPEHADLKPAEHWNLRARGLGATRRRPSTSCGEENLLEFRGDPYRGENILIHEFAHTIHSMGLSSVDPTFDGRLRSAYETAMAAGLWKGTYAASNRGEYWAEGVQSWFDCNQAKNFIHNGIRTREAIREYDPGLSALLAEVFGDNDWRYLPPSRRPEPGHLAGLDRGQLPAFAWPEELLRWRKQEAERAKRESSEQ
jgi:hypothetical protein